MLNKKILYKSIIRYINALDNPSYKYAKKYIINFCDNFPTDIKRKTLKNIVFSFTDDSVIRWLFEPVVFKNFNNEREKLFDIYYKIEKNYESKRFI